ncbi:MAG TPA: acyl-CoA dehydrogenase [Steroidobacteraceae bacterium]|nr:acyl-CoA dehydrogenase [Steroidobacteraceae bacterium]
MEHAARYHPNRDQLAIATEVTASLESLLPLSRLHASPEESDATWQALADMGLFGMTRSEEHGGSGLGLAEEALIVMGLGRRLIAPGVIASVGAMHTPDFAAAPTDIAVNRVAAGYRCGERLVKIAEHRSRFVLLRQDDRSLLIESNEAAPRLDSRLWLADLRRLTDAGEPLAVFAGADQLRLRLLDAAILVGAAETALDMAVAYAGVREQFGRPIGSFQAVKHHCANMALAARRARDQTSFAAVALEAPREDARLQVECAFLTAGNAALESARLNIQIHGGIGFSDEADPHLVLKRAQLYINIGGGLEAAAARIAAIEPIL